MIQGYAQDGLLGLLQASEQEKEERGIRYTPQEIFRQPATWETTHRICADHRPELRRFLQESGVEADGKANSTPPVFLVGAGTSDYIGRALIPLMRRLWKREVWAVPSTDLLTNPEDLIFADRPYLWVSFSRSGESSEGLAVLELAIQKYPKVRHVLVTCNPKSSMAVACEKAPGRAMVLSLDDSANDRGLAMTSSYTNMVIAGQCLAHVFSPESYETTFSLLQQTGTRFLDRAQDAAAALVQQGFSKACFVGSGALRAVAQESMLKVLELTAGRIYTLAESTLGLRHGPMSVLDENTACVNFLSRDPQRRNYELDLIEEIQRKGLGKFLVAVVPESNPSLRKLTDWELSLDAPDLSDEYRAPVDVILGQLLGLFSSLQLGLKPDNPSPNDAISRVVSHVKIYSRPG